MCNATAHEIRTDDKKWRQNHVVADGRHKLRVGQKLQALDCGILPTLEEGAEKRCSKCESANVHSLLKKTNNWCWTCFNRKPTGQSICTHCPHKTGDKTYFNVIGNYEPVQKVRHGAGRGRGGGGGGAPA